MPFTVLDKALDKWKAALPKHFDYTPQNASMIIAAGHGKLLAMMLMRYFQARAYLHREYIPFTARKDYDPVLGKQFSRQSFTVKISFMLIPCRL
jgi:hypothetical protein